MSQATPQSTSEQPKRRVLWRTLPLLLLAGIIFTAADRESEGTPCRALEIEVDQLDGMYFVDAPSLRTAVIREFPLLDQPMVDLPYNAIHKSVMAQHGVAECKVQPTLGGALHISVRQQRPIARVWTPDSSLYLDDAGRSLPLSNRYSAEVPVVHAPSISSASLAMPLLNKMDQDPFWDRFIDQIAVHSDGTIQFHPRIGDLVVQLGAAEDLDGQLDAQLGHLKTFYTAHIDSGDLRQYTALDLRYEGQLVARK